MHDPQCGPRIFLLVFVYMKAKNGDPRNWGTKFNVSFSPQSMHVQFS